MKIPVAALGSLVPIGFLYKVVSPWGGGNQRGYGMGPGMMGWEYYGMGWIGMIIMLVFLIVVILGIVYLIKWIVHSIGRDNRRTKSEDSPLDILKKRYARGEIQKEEFEEKKRDLGY